MGILFIFHNPEIQGLKHHQSRVWIEQGLTSPPTQYRLSRRQFDRSKDPTNSIQVLKEKLASHRPEEAQNPPSIFHRVTSKVLEKEKNPPIPGFGIEKMGRDPGIRDPGTGIINVDFNMHLDSNIGQWRSQRGGGWGVQTHPLRKENN